MDLARETIPKDMPLFVRISATDWLEENSNAELRDASWKLDEAVKNRKLNDLLDTLEFNQVTK